MKQINQRHHKPDFSSEISDEPMKLESQILQILYLSNSKSLSSGKIAHVLPGKHSKKRLVDLLLHDLSKRKLVDIQKLQTLVHPNAGGWEKTDTRNPASDKEVIIQKDESGKPNILDLTHTVYFITEMGIQMIQKDNQISDL